MCFMFDPTSEWKEDIERIGRQTHSDVKKYAAQLVCDCSNKLALRKSKQPWSQDRMFLTCRKKEYNFFMWIDHRQPKLNIREPLNYKDLYGNTTDLCKMSETNIVFSIKSTYPVSTCILCHLPAFQADSKRFR